MIPLRRTEPDSDAWKQWRQEATAQGKALSEAWKTWLAARPPHQPLAEYRKKHKPPDIGKLYKEQAEVIKSWSGGRCAYCEALIHDRDQPGDIEHFRPKGRATDAAGKSIENHVGYYWLAFDWTNLMLACAMCNRPSTNEEGMARGKWDKFPLRDEGTRAFGNGKKHLKERPEFLDPFAPGFKTEDHFSFQRDGVIVPLSPEVKATVKHLDLNREGLRIGRRNAWKLTRRAWVEAMHKAIDGDAELVLEAACELKAVKDGDAEFCGACRAMLATIESHPVKKNFLDTIYAYFDQCDDGQAAAEADEEPDSGT